MHHIPKYINSYKIILKRPQHVKKAALPLKEIYQQITRGHKLAVETTSRIFNEADRLIIEATREQF